MAACSQMPIPLCSVHIHSFCEGSFSSFGYFAAVRKMAPLWMVISLVISLFLTPFLMFLLAITFLASIGKSLGVRRLYIKLLLALFEVRHCERANIIFTYICCANNLKIVNWIHNAYPVGDIFISLRIGNELWSIRFYRFHYFSVSIFAPSLGKKKHVLNEKNVSPMVYQFCANLG